MKRQKHQCPEYRDEFCEACSLARKIVDTIDAIMVGNDTVPSLYWAGVRLERWKRAKRLDALVAKRTRVHPNAPRQEWAPPPPGECMGTTFTGMGKDGDGTDMDIDANGGYSNARRIYEESRAD